MDGTRSHLLKVAVGAAVAALTVLASGGRAGAQAPPAPVNTLLDFHQMAPVTAPFVGRLRNSRSDPVAALGEAEHCGIRR